MPKTSTVATELAALLAESQSATLFTDIEGLDDAAAAALLTSEPPLHVERDVVRGLWAVRKATPEEVAEAEASTEAAPAEAVAPQATTA
jgi:hypothetical protein